MRSFYTKTIDQERLNNAKFVSIFLKTVLFVLGFLPLALVQKFPVKLFPELLVQAKEKLILYLLELKFRLR